MRDRRQCFLCGPSAVAMRSREPDAAQRLDDECAVSPASAAAIGGVRRLRDELNAALLSQRQQHLAFVQRHTHGKVDTTPSTSTRETIRQSAWKIHSTSSPALVKTQVWSDLDAALKSLKFQSCATALGHVKDNKYGSRPKADCAILEACHGRQSKHTARTSRVAVPDQVIECARRGKRHPHAEPAAREEISRRYLTLWKSLARTTAIARLLSRRATSHHRDSLARHAFHAWQLHWRNQQYLHRACRVVASQSNIALLDAAYRRWRHAFRFEWAYRALQRSRRRRLLRTVMFDWQARARFRRRQSQHRCLSQERASRAAWECWRQFISHRHQQVSRNAVAQAHFLRWQWKKLVRQIQHRIERRRVIEHHLKKRWRRTREVYFDGWIEFIDRKTREQLGMKWYRERLLETVFANWKAAHDRVRYIQILEKRAHKKICRHRLRRCLHHWVRAARYIAQRAVRLKQISARILVRRAFGKLHQLGVVMLEREQYLQTWKLRRALHTWLERAGEQRETALRGAAIARNHSAFIKRTFGWHPWRLAYQRSSGASEITARRAQREMRRAWSALKAAAADKRRRRSLTALLFKRIISRRLKLVVSAWADYAYASQVGRQQIQQSSAFYDSALKRRSFTAWCHVQREKRRQRAMDIAADDFIRKRVLLQWRNRADQLRWGRVAKLAEANQYWRKTLVRKCLAAWSSFSLQQQSWLRRWAFVTWCRSVRLKRAQRALMAVTRLLELCRRWHRWRALVKYNAELHQRGTQLSVKHQSYVKHSFFVDQWLAKTRRYRCAQQLISALDRNATSRQALTQWKLWHADQLKRHRATGFHEHRLLLRSLHKLHDVTVGWSQLAKRYYSRCQLTQVWRAWLVLRDRSKLKTLADGHCRKFKVSRGLAYLQANASRTQTTRTCRQRADQWRRTVIVQTGFAHWYFTVQRRIRLCQEQKQVQLRCIGVRHFRAWRLALDMKRKTRVAVAFRRQVGLKRGFDRWLQITKRRLVAVAMWRYAMARIRSTLALAAWKRHTGYRRRVRLGTEALGRRRCTRLIRICFSQWELMVAVEASRSICLERHAIRWVNLCWVHWRRFVTIKRRCHERRSKTLGSSFVGLQRLAIRNKTGRFLYQQSARSAMGRALRVWRVEFRLARVQRSASRSLLQQCLHDWAMYVSGCRQQREWIRYIQRLHQIHESNDECSKTEAMWKAPSLLVRHNRIENRDLLRRVLHAWYLATKSSQRRRQRDISALKPASTITSSPRKRPATGSRARSGATTVNDRRRAVGASNRMLALRFWSDHLVLRTFYAWKHRSQIRKSPR